MFDCKRLLNKAKANKGLLSTIGAIIGVGVSIYLTSKATLKVEETLKTYHTPEECKKVKKTVVKEVAKPAISTALTIFCIVLTYKFGKAAEAGALTLLAGSEEMLRNYRNTVKESGKFTEEEEQDIFDKAKEYEDRSIPEKPMESKEMAQKLELFRESLTGEYFWATTDIILNAQLKLNRNINLRGCESFWFWLQCLTDNDIFNEYKLGAEHCGWCDYAEEKYGYRFVDICVRKKETPSGTPYNEIIYPFAPHGDYDDDLWENSRYLTVCKLLKTR